MMIELKWNVDASRKILETGIATKITYDARSLLFNGQRKLIVSGSIHYPRSTPEMWPDLIQTAQKGGLNTIETYIFWNLHEPMRRQYDFKGGKDFIRFFKTIQSQGLYAIMRIGPYVCAEWNYGGFPLWLHNIPGIKLRTDNQIFKDEMQTFTNLIVDMAKKANLFASQGGPIILSQIENEYGNIMEGYGNDGKEYIRWCTQLAVNQSIDEPWIMCQQSDAPAPMLNTCDDYYCDQFTPNRNTTPKIWSENWTGWFKAWGEAEPHRTAEDVAYAVARFFQNGGSIQNYYMYHGGTNFGRTSGGPYITTSYDYDAPLDEYGNINQPKWGHLKQLHEILYLMEQNLLHGKRTSKTLSKTLGNTVEATIYSLGKNSSCFISNDDKVNQVTTAFNGKRYTIPAWSVSVLPDCKHDVYNTAKVNTQTNVKIKKSNNVPEVLKWMWIREEFSHFKKHHLQGDFTLNRLIDQKEVNDTSDYLWYMTSIHLSDYDPLLGTDIILRVNTTGGQVLHSFVNDVYKASKWATLGHFDLVFDSHIQLAKGINKIAILSATVGFQNYGAFFDEGPVGIVGTVQLVVNKNNSLVKDLSATQWVYKVGLDGEKNEVYNPDRSSNLKWKSDPIANSSFTWYKTTFKTPLGKDPVVIDLKGMGKGHAWVNGNSIGRYWPSFTSNIDGCDKYCDYRGQYKPEKCRTNCGNSTQRWYHVPRSFLNAIGMNNTLILFEEFGGDLSNIKIQTVVVEKICANAYEGSTLTLTCPSNIKNIQFASFGDAKGVCGLFKIGNCESTSAKDTLNKACVGKPTCTINVSEAALGFTRCIDTPKRLAVEAVC